jgi:hypothetical protein
MARVNKTNLPVSTNLHKVDKAGHFLDNSIHFLRCAYKGDRREVREIRTHWGAPRQPIMPRKAK